MGVVGEEEEGGRKTSNPQFIIRKRVPEESVKGSLRAHICPGASLEGLAGRGRERQRESMRERARKRHKEIQTHIKTPKHTPKILITLRELQKLF